MRKGYAFSGFTIVEVLIVLVISSAFLGTAVASYRNYSSRQVITSIKRQIVTDLRKAQKDVVSGRKPDGCVGTLLGYRFTIASSTSYTIQAMCNSSVLVKNVNLSDNSTLSIDNSGPNSITFLPLNAGTNMGSATRTINISVTNLGTATLTVTKNGEIRE